ncbi:MAG TPA: hypothetical protein VHZ97_20535 [Pseudonocardiaceae bacterium]|jgi:hypothetical protein|nr:hypothetical protein [Pseudonocardiaceae bacterium]
MGWRWETYHGIEVRVPEDWGYGTTRWPPCIPQPPHAYVGRPGALPLPLCRDPVAPLASRVAYLWFNSRSEAGAHTYDAGWADETRIIDGIAITVLTDDDQLRERLLDSVRPMADDTDHSIIAGPDARPDPGRGGLAGVGTVESVTITRYELGSDATNPMLSRTTITGDPAAELVRAILAAPEGTGPNSPGDCAQSVMFGNQAIVLRVRGTEGTQEVFVRYSGCDGHGFDDGQVRRRLTAEALRPVLAGPHRPGTLNRSVAELVWLGRSGQQ